MYLGSIFSRDGRYEMDVEMRIAAGNRVNGALAACSMHDKMKRRTQCSFGTDTVIRRRNVGITEEE